MWHNADEGTVWISKAVLQPQHIYGWIATLLYRSVKKIDEKKFSILNTMISALCSIIWEEYMNEFSRLPLSNCPRYDSFSKNTV
jgi:hypothetical protein